MMGGDLPRLELEDISYFAGMAEPGSIVLDLAQQLEANLWLLAEARWHAEWSRNAWAQFADLLDLDDDVGTKATVAKPLPWEIAGKVADANG